VSPPQPNITRRQLLRYGGALGAGLALSACTNGKTVVSSTVPTPTLTPTSTPTPPPPQMKPKVGGVASRGITPIAGTYPPVLITTVDSDWSTLQPTNGGPIATNNDIDGAIRWAKANRGFVRLRVMCGASTPPWAMNLDGPATRLDTADATGLTVPIWWGPNYQAAYQDLQTKLAAKYDQVDVVRMVFVTMPMVEYGEPLIRFWSKNVNAKTYAKAGYTTTADRAAILAAFQAHASAWTTTPQGFSYNPWDGGGGASWTFVIADQIATFGRATVVQNNSIGNGGSTRDNYRSMYHDMVASGAAVQFQMAAPANMSMTGDAAMAMALSYGASLMELPRAYNQTWTNAALGVYSAKFKANLG
jgi:TAT (twin-arginine translocation) pathway signal sequence